ncbi:hypothetical protein BKA82DRAFT_26662 [Pisolithus tinctorius]|uniref:Uncharacterized protein n=1 Tax=Pisolithus tinctorius Marx 270 TaxID=870435 RepID=A0A0C3K3G6_PISTI|nr:hypothetical protein BKA82DRAFT_26662 [Pisolithus tinctorius]KIO04072.1 hypothetical protein M404DRAFT_26662 [Pisolithus tinctorius Marx 270]
MHANLINRTGTGSICIFPETIFRVLSIWIESHHIGAYQFTYTHPREGGLVDSSHGIVEYCPSPVSTACTQAPSTHASTSNSGEQLEQHSNTSYMVGGISRDAAWEPSQRCVATAQNLAQEVNSRYKANSDTRCPSHAKIYAKCPRMRCLRVSANGTQCLRMITCATVSEHFASHGVKGKSRTEYIPCNWMRCRKLLKRHNFVRHIREKHLGHIRGSSLHSSPKDVGQMGLPILDREIKATIYKLQVQYDEILRILIVLLPRWKLDRAYKPMSVEASLGNFNTAVASLQLYPGIVYVAAVYKHDVVLILAEGIHATSIYRVRKPDDYGCINTPISEFVEGLGTTKRFCKFPTRAEGGRGMEEGSRLARMNVSVDEKKMERMGQAFAERLFDRKQNRRFYPSQ